MPAIDWKWQHEGTPDHALKRRYFGLIREAMPGAEAARQVGVSTSCGSLWFIDAGSVRALEPTPIDRRFLSQDDRIEIADGLGRGELVKSIAARIGKSYQAGRNRVVVTIRTGPVNRSPGSVRPTRRGWELPRSLGLVTATEADPATPCCGGVALARALGPSANLLTVSGGGHTALDRSPCVAQQVTLYLVEVRVPGGHAC